MDGLTNGLLVHYGSNCRAAVITHIWEDSGTVNLYVFNDGVNQPGEVITKSTYGRNPTQWHWIERSIHG